MKKLLFIFVTILSLAITAGAQNVAINSTGATANSSAMLDVSSSNTGILIPRVALTGTTSASPVTSPATSLLVYNTATVSDVTPGYYYWTGTAWIRLYAGPTNAWNLTGNSGTAPATNFIGTTDAQDWVIRTTNTERARVLATGNILFNRTTALYATDLIEAQGNATFPDAINGFTDQGTGSGVYGECSAGGGIGVVGYNSTATGAGTGPGVYGQSNQTGAAGVWGSGSTFTRGVLGSTNNNTYAGTQGQNAHIDGDGVVGINSGASGAGTGTGVFGQCSQGGNGASGVYGYNDNNAGAGIIGYNAAAASTGNGKGVAGVTSQSGGSAAGVYSNNTNAAGEGLIAFNSAAAGADFGDAIFGQTAQSGGAGAFLVNTNATGTGIIASGNNSATSSYLVSGSGGAFTGSVTGVYGYATSTTAGTNRFGGYFANASSDYVYVGGRNTGNTVRKIEGSGTVNTVVTDVNGNRVTLTCPEAPDILFMDFGTAKLVNGKAHISIDPTFSKNIFVDDNNPLKVFVQLEGDCNGVFVSNKSATGFDVTELNNGSSNVSFSYQIVAQRADEYGPDGNISAKYVVGRFAPAIPPMEVGIKNIKVQTPDTKSMLNNGVEKSSAKDISIDKAE